MLTQNSRSIVSDHVSVISFLGTTVFGTQMIIVNNSNIEPPIFNGVGAQRFYIFFIISMFMLKASLWGPTEATEHCSKLSCVKFSWWQTIHRQQIKDGCITPIINIDTKSISVQKFRNVIQCGGEQFQRHYVFLTHPRSSLICFKFCRKTEVQLMF